VWLPDLDFGGSVHGSRLGRGLIAQAPTELQDFPRILKTLRDPCELAHTNADLPSSGPPRFASL
jgi:hypothetical protein